MTRLKKNTLLIHRWLGLTSGLVVFIVSITGCIFCFQDEIQDAIHPWRKVEVQQQAFVTPSFIKQTVLAQHPNATANYIYYFGNDRPAMALVTSKTALLDVYLNPYTGRIIHTEAVQSNFFTVVEYIHLYLLLPPAIGAWVVGISVIIFMVLMITGLVLWWPKRKADRKHSFAIKWNARWRRVNYDLHKVLGFYTTAIALILALSGLSIAFNWVRDGLYRTANLGESYPVEKKSWLSDTIYQKPSGVNALDDAFVYARQHSPNAQMFLLVDDGQKASAISVTAYAKSLHYGNSDFYYFDRYRGKLLNHLPYASKSTGMKLNDLNYDIHVGQALGLFGKIIAFLVSLICASLPVTGLVMYIGRVRKR